MHEDHDDHEDYKEAGCDQITWLQAGGVCANVVILVIFVIFVILVSPPVRVPALTLHSTSTAQPLRADS